MTKLQSLVSKDKKYKLYYIDKNLEWINEGRKNNNLDNLLFWLQNKIPQEKIYIVGGGIRDFYLQKPISDLDIVIKSKEKKSLFDIFKNDGICEKTAFGGLMLKLDFEGLKDFLIDIWYFDDAYNLQTGNDYNEADFLSGFDFKINSAMYELNSKTLFYCSDFFNDLDSQRICFNNLNCVAMISMLIARSILLRNKLSFRLDEKIIQYIKKNYQTSFNVEIKKYLKIKGKEQDFYPIINEIRKIAC